MLQVKKENLPGSKVKLTIIIPPQLMRDYFARSYKKLASKVEVRGFRTAKAPKKLTI